MNASQRKVFHFHADANPIGGRITAPVDQLLPPHGSASLAQAGGHATGQIGPHRIDGVLSFKDARSEVFGHQHDPAGGWTTTVSSVVEGLNILDIVRADALVTKIKLTHRQGYTPSVSFAGTHFYNFTIAGERVCPILDLATFARSEKDKTWWEEDPRHLGAAMAHNERLVESAKKAGNSAWIEERYGWMTANHEKETMAGATKEEHKARAEERIKRGSIVCSLVKEIDDASGKTQRPDAHGHILNVPDVGLLFLGELSVNRGLFRVTLLRAELGCQADGDVSAANGAAADRGDGTGMP